MCRSIVVRTFLAATAALALLSVRAERTSNSFFTIEGEGVRIASDGSICVDSDASGPVKLTARSGWLVNGRESVSYRSARGLSSGLILTSKLGEDHFCSPPPPTEEDKHDTTFVLEAAANPTNLIKMYALPSTSIVVTASAESSLVEKGKHKVTTTWQEWTCPVCGAHQEGRTEVSYYDVEPDTYEWTAEAAGVTQASSTWTGTMSKGTGQEIEFTVTGRRDSCQECVATATDTATADVHELSIKRPDYLGLDWTDAGLSGRAVTNATAHIDPAPASATYNWTKCGKCQFDGETDEQKVTYGIANSATASTSFLAEDLTVTATAKNADGLSASATCTTNFTIVAVDVTIGTVGEDKEEKVGAFVQYVADTNGIISVEGTNKMVEVKFTCKPSLPENEMVTISHAGSGELYEVLASGEYSLVMSGDYRACDVSSRTFKLHGHAVSASVRDGLIKIEHKTSGAVDETVYTVVKVDLMPESLFGVVGEIEEESNGAYVHWNVDNDDSSDNSVGAPKHPGGDYLQSGSAPVAGEDDLKSLTVTLLPKLTEGVVKLYIDADKAKCWKSPQKGSANLVLAGGGERCWNLGDSLERQDFESICSCLCVEGVDAGECNITLDYEAPSGAGACSDKVKYTFISANCGDQPKTDTGERDDIESWFPGLIRCEWSITGAATSAYNCIAWSVGESNAWYNPQDIDEFYGNNDGVFDDSDMDAFYYKKKGWRPCSSANDAEAIYYSYANAWNYLHESPPSVGYHGAKKKGCDCGKRKWFMFESKCGKSVKIEHVWNQLNGSLYGTATRFYK